MYLFALSFACLCVLPFLGFGLKTHNHVPNYHLFLSPQTISFLQPLTGGTVVVNNEFPTCVGVNPNPATDAILTLSALNESVLEKGEIRSLNGQILMSKTFTESVETWNLQQLTVGRYVLYLKTHNCEVQYLMEVL